MTSNQVETTAIQTTDDDVEGHIRVPLTDETDDVEGHIRVPLTDETDDVEGHLRQL